MLGKQACPNENSLQAQSKPWITKGIRTSKRKKITFFNADWEYYKLNRNKITSLTRQSKKNYYERYFEENIKNSKET